MKGTKSENGNGMVSSDSGSSSLSSSPLLQLQQQSSSMSASQFKLLLLIGMVLQNSSTVLVGRYTRAGVDKADQYDVNHLILVIELGKLVLSAILEFVATQGKLTESIHMHIVSAPEDALKISIPALLYLVQNTLLYVALTNLTAPLFQVTYQCKLVTTAFVSVLMLKVKYTIQQWICLLMISIGVAIVVLGETKDNDPTKAAAKATAMAQTNLSIGLTAVTIACFSSACAGVYFEMVLKTKKDATSKPPASLWMRNIQLSFISIIIAVLQGLFQESTSNAYLHGFTGWTWVLVLLQAGGGLLVAAVIKYADNVLKGLATGVSVVLATGLSMLLFNTPVTYQFGIGAVMILVAVYYFSNPLPNAVAGHMKKVEDSMNGNSNNTKNNINNNNESNVEIKSLLPK